MPRGAAPGKSEMCAEITLVGSVGSILGIGCGTVCDGSEVARRIRGGAVGKLEQKYFRLVYRSLVCYAYSE